MGLRAQSEDVDEHALVITNPIGIDQAMFRVPAHRDGRATVRSKEIPVRALVETLGEATDLALGRVITVVILAGEKHAHEQDRGIDAGKLHAAVTQARLHVQEMVEKAVVASDSGGLVEAKHGTGYVIPVKTIERYEPVFDEHSMPRPVIRENDSGPWVAALRELLTLPHLTRGATHRTARPSHYRIALAREASSIIGAPAQAENVRKD